MGKYVVQEKKANSHEVDTDNAQKCVGNWLIKVHHLLVAPTTFVLVFTRDAFKTRLGFFGRFLAAHHPPLTPYIALSREWIMDAAAPVTLLMTHSSAGTL